MPKLHPRYEGYGFDVTADAQLVRSFEHRARQAGWDQRSIDTAYGWFKENSARMASLPVEARVASFLDYATSRGLSAEAANNAVDWFDATAARLERGEAPELPPTPTRDQDLARQAELQTLMRENPDRYFKSAAADELYDIIARQEEAGAPQQAANNQVAAQAPTGRRAELEQMMKEGAPDYWKNEAAQTEYRQLLGGDQSMPGAAGGPARGAAEGGAAGGETAPTGGST